MSYEPLAVLVLDDDVSVRTLMARQLIAMGVGNVIEAATYKDAEAILQNVVVNGAFLDLVLQRGSGLDVGKLMLRHKVPVVFCTSTSDAFNNAQMLELGWVLPKPVRLAGLHRAMRWFACSAKCDCDVE